MFKKRLTTCLLLLAVATLGILSLALADGKLPYDRSRVVIPNLDGIAPVVAKSRCDSVSKTKGTFKTYTTAGYIGIELDAVDNTGAAVKGKLKLDGRQVSVGSAPFKVTNASGSAFSSASFDGYSAPIRTLDFCIRRQ